MFRDEQVTITLAVPAMLNFMLPTYRPELRDSLRLRWIMSGAAPVPPSLIESYARLGFGGSGPSMRPGVRDRRGARRRRGRTWRPR